MRFTVLLVALLALSLATGHAAEERTIIFGRAADSTYLDPAQFLDNESAKVIENIFDGLVRFKDDSTEVEPALATSWSVSEDGTVWTFVMREGVRFHDGTPCDAEAAAFSFQRKLFAWHPYHREEFSKRDNSLAVVERVEALDKRTLRFTLREPYAPFLNVLATHSSYVVCPEAVKRLGAEYAKQPVGSGPFVFSKWTVGDRIILKANPGYWGGAPRLDTVIFKVIPDHAARLRELSVGAIHVMDNFRPQDRTAIRESGNIELVSWPGLNVGYLAMNTEKPPFTDLRVRRAVNHAVNKANLVKLLYQGMATPAKGPIPPSMWGYDPDQPDYDYSPEKARALLADAGYPKGFATTLWAMPVPRTYMPEPTAIAEALKANLAAVGIRARIVSHDWKTYLEKLYSGEHDMALLGWGATPDPDNFFHNLFSSEKAEKPHASNITFFRDPRADELIQAGQRIVDASRREAVYKELQGIIHDQAPWVPLAHANQVIAHVRSVKGVVLHLTGVVRFNKASLQ